jgi:glutamate-ammonia-ligase adenylyltransferase
MLGKIFEAARGEKYDSVRIKNAEGGIVEIEFLVQLLQLKHGPHAEELRITNTLAALGTLAESGHLPRQAYDNLKATLVFLRRVENRLRLMHDRPLGELPSDQDALDSLALRLSMTAAADRTPGDAFMDALESHIHRSHRVFEEQIRQLRDDARAQ